MTVTTTEEHGHIRPLQEHLDEIAARRQAEADEEQEQADRERLEHLEQDYYSDVEEEFSEDACGYARTIHRGLESPRERRALAAVYEEMPCSVAAVARAAGFSRRTAQRACDALESDQVALIQRIESGLVIHPDAVEAVDAWAHRHGNRSDIVAWWEDPEPAADPGGRFDPDSDGWPDDVFPDPGFDDLPPGAENIELAVRAVENRRTPRRKGAMIPFPVLDYVTATRSIQAVKVAIECGRRADRHGVATFARGELAKVTGLSSQQVSDTLARMRREGIAVGATATRVGLDLEHR